MYSLDVEPLDLGVDVRAVGLELAEADENREPVRGPDAARIWSRVLRATAADETWALDFFSHLDRLRDYCRSHQITYREASQRSIVIPAPELAKPAIPVATDTHSAAARQTFFHDLTRIIPTDRQGFGRALEGNGLPVTGY